MFVVSSLVFFACCLTLSLSLPLSLDVNEPLHCKVTFQPNKDIISNDSNIPIWHLMTQAFSAWVALLLTLRFINVTFFDVNLKDQTRYSDCRALDITYFTVEITWPLCLQINVQTSSNTAKQLNLTENQVSAYVSIGVCSYHLFSLSPSGCWAFSRTTIVQLSQRSLYHRPTSLCLFPSVVLC